MAPLLQVIANHRWWAAAVAAFATGTAALAQLTGAAPAVAAALGLLLLGAVAWLPPAAVRNGTPLALGLFFFALARPGLGIAVAAPLGAGLALVTWRKVSLPVLRRISFLLPSLVYLIFVTTILMYLAPGNPFAEERVAAPQVEAALRAQYGVPDNALEFFQIYMRRLLFEGSLGPSVKVQGRTVEGLLLPALPVSLALGVLALTLAVVIGLTLGVIAGLRPNSAADYGSMGLALFGISLPNFVIGALFIIVFALKLRWLPVAGWGSLQHIILPAITLALPYAAFIARLARGGTLEVMQQDFIRTARAKGLPEHQIVLSHALKGAVLPVVSFLGPAAAGILTGSFVVESLFGLPGMGQWFVKGAINRDYAVVLGTAVIYTSLVTMFNLAVDIAYGWLDPRVRDQL